MSSGNPGHTANIDDPTRTRRADKVLIPTTEFATISRAMQRSRYIPLAAVICLLAAAPPVSADDVLDVDRDEQFTDTGEQVYGFADYRVKLLPPGVAVQHVVEPKVVRRPPARNVTMIADYSDARSSSPARNVEYHEVSSAPATYAGYSTVSSYSGYGGGYGNGYHGGKSYRSYNWQPGYGRGYGYGCYGPRYRPCYSNVRVGFGYGWGGGCRSSSGGFVWISF